jgi:hypothetical protein
MVSCLEANTYGSILTGAAVRRTYLSKSNAVTASSSAAGRHTFEVPQNGGSVVSRNALGLGLIMRRFVDD